MAERERRRVCVTGCPKSGTTYVCAVLRELGLKVRHEEMGPDGTSSFWFGPAVALIKPGFDKIGHADGLMPQDVDFDVLVHLVRHPLRACANMPGFLTQRCWRYAEVHAGVNRKLPQPLRSVAFWVRWNRMVAARNPDVLVRLERLPEDWPALARALGLPEAVPDVPAKNVARTGRFAPKPFTWADVQDQGVARAARKLAAEYGYDPDKPPPRVHAVTGAPLDARPG